MGWAQSTTIATTAGGTTATTSAITTSGGSGTVLVAHAASYNQTVTVTDSKSNSWTNIRATGAIVGRIRMDYCPNPVGGSSHTFTATVGTNDYPTISVQELTAMAAASVLDQSAIDDTTGNATSHATPTITTTQANETIVACFSSASGCSYTITGADTQDRELDTGSNEGLCTSRREVSSIAGYVVTATTNNSVSVRRIIASFKQLVTTFQSPQKKFQAVKRASFY